MRYAAETNTGRDAAERTLLAGKFLAGQLQKASNAAVLKGLLTSSNQ